MTANPTLPPASIGMLVGVSEDYVKAIVLSPLGSLLNMYRRSPPPNLNDFKVDPDWAVKAYILKQTPPEST